MEFCPPNITFSEFWLINGTSECFMDTVTAVSLAVFIFIFGSAQWWMYKKYGSRRIAVHSSKLYYLQIYVSLLMMLSIVVKYSLLASIMYYKTLFIYHIVAASCLLFALGFGTYLTFIERNYQLPSVPSNDHGLVLLLFWTLLLIFSNLTFINLKRPDWWFQLKTQDDKIEMYLFVIHYVGSLVLFVLGLKAPGISSYRNLGSERTHNINNSNNQPGDQSTWSGFFRKIKALFPYLWPQKNLLLKIRVLLCFVILLLGRLINLYVPIYNKLLVNSMIDVPLVFRWDYVLIYVAFKFLQGGGTGGMGLLNNIRTYLWIGVQQYTTREIDIQLFKHLHTLSLRWHLSRKTGEVVTIMGRGTDSVSNLLNFILFQIIPTIVDILIAIVFFISSFNSLYGLIVFITMGLYLVATIIVTEWRTIFQRRMNLAKNAQKARSIDSLLNFETVKYYGGEQHEVNAYRECILNYQREELKNSCSLIFLNSLQNFIITGGLLAGSLFCVHQVVNEKTLTVGDYTLFASYILQLYVPLNWFGTYYRAIQKNFVDMENMFDLMNEKCEVEDTPGAPSIFVTHGSVEFRDVTFSYTPDRTILKNLSFFLPAGKTLALVGHSGSGKSTIVRLIFRFYDPDSGEVLIDNQNLRTVTQSSVRRAIGVVPQDTVLFNDTLEFNIGYGRLGASEEAIVDAAKNADIHDRIMNFPDSYKTQVGERGLKLSGGEKQRVAIARTILKSPEIVLLDEATSALDTQTERNIQSSLQRVCSNRTTIIVAHRLSTIIHADQILVLSEGEIIERGKHEELLSQNGVYASMWTQQNNKETSDKPEVSSS